MKNIASIHPFPSRPAPQESGAKLRIVPPAPAKTPWTYRADLKWVFGIPFTLFLSLTLIVLALFLFTSAGTAQETIAAMNKPIVSEPLLLDGKARAAAPEMVAFLENPDFARMVYEDHALLDKQIAVIPDGATQSAAGAEAPATGNDGSGEEADNPGQGIKSMMNFYSLPLKLLSSETHATLGAALTVLIVLLLVTGIPFVAISRRMGRFVSAGVSIAIASWLPFLALSVFQSGLPAMLSKQGGAGGAEGSAENIQLKVIVEIVRPFAENSVGQVVSVFRLFALLALACFLIAGTGVLVRRLRRRKSAA